MDKPKIDLKKIKTPYFIGIGGIGMSAIARMFLLEEKTVSGSDSSGSKITDELAKLGAKIFLDQNKKNIPAKCDLVVYTNALLPDNPELVEAKRRKIPLFTYPEMLHVISAKKFTIAISGTHGKTTTTAMVAKILIDAKLDPTVIVGSLLAPSTSSGQAATNFVFGTSDYFVVEADEYRRSFLNLEPKILAINNLDYDHNDYFKNLADMQSAFRELAEKIPESGFLICDKKDKHLAPVLKGLACTVLHYPNVSVAGWKLKVPGEHNRKNAQVAATVAGVLGVSEEEIQLSLEGFQGTWRRFEFKGKTASGALVYDDYAHNPAKVRAALQGAREVFGTKKIFAIFQPHLFSRTKHFLHEFAGAFSDADEIILAPIFPAREVFDPSITSEMLGREIVKKGKKAKVADNFEKIIEYVKKNAKKGDVVMTIGAGDIYKVGEQLLK